VKISSFSINQILREINFWNSRSAKSAILTHLEALNFDFYEFLHFLKAEIDQKLRCRVSKLAKSGIFRTSSMSKNDFTQNLSDRKMLKFPHCVALSTFFPSNQRFYKIKKILKS